MTLAWANVDANGGGTPSLISGFNISGTITRAPSGYESCAECYELTFLTPATSSGSYAVMGIVVDSSSDSQVVVRELEQNSFVIKTVQDDGVDPDDVNFTVILVGY